MILRIAYALTLSLTAHTWVSVLVLRRIRPGGRIRSISHAMKKGGLKDTECSLKETAPSRRRIYTFLFVPRESRQYPFMVVEGEPVEFKSEGRLLDFVSDAEEMLNTRPLAVYSSGRSWSVSVERAYTNRHR